MLQRHEIFLDQLEDQCGGADLQRRGDLAHVGIADDDVKPPVKADVRVRLIPGIDDGAAIHRVDGTKDAEKIRTLRNLKDPLLALRILAFDAHLARAGVNLARDQKRHDPGDNAVPRHLPAHQKIVMAAVRVADKVGVVLVKPHFLAGLGELFISPTRAFFKDALARLVLSHELPQRGALGRRVLRVRVVVIKARSIREDEIALDLLVGKRAVLVDFVIGGLVGVLHQLRGPESAGILVRVFQIVIPLHQGAVFRVPADNLDGLVDDIDVVHVVDRDAVFRLNAEDALHGIEQKVAKAAKWGEKGCEAEIFYRKIAKG